MAGSVTVHVLGGTKKAKEACRLVEALYLAGKRVVVFLADEGRAKILDDMLWTFSTESFVPHQLWGGEESVEDPVVVVAERLANPNGASTLVIADRLGDLVGARDFVEIHDLVAQVAEDADKAAAWRAAGFSVREVRGVSI